MVPATVACATKVVLFASYSGAFGGAERLLIDWAGGLEGDGCLACPDGALANAAGAGGLRVWPLPSRSMRLRDGYAGGLRAGLALFAHARELRELISNLDPDLVVAWGMRSAIALSLGSRIGAPLVFQHNDMLPGRLTGALVRAAADRAAVVTVPSRAVAEDLGGGAELAGRIEVVHPGVDVGRFSADTAPSQPPEVLVLGALVPWKRPELAIEACAIARRRRPDMRLRLVGEPIEAGDDRWTSALRARAGTLDGAVDLAGPSSDVPGELARATCLLHCADREPFGLAVLEALAAARPVVIPAAGGPAEIADESCALLYPPGDAKAAADAVVRVLSDPELAVRMGAAGRERARTVFDGAAARDRWAQAIAPARRTARSCSVEIPTLSSVEVVTVTHNSSSVVSGLLGSVRRWLPDARVLVVDCASSDRTVEVARGFPRTHVIALEENVGFGRACNLGVAEAQAPAVALLNPDVELVDDSLLLAIAEVRRHVDRLLAPLVLSSDGTRQDTVHPVPGSLPELARSVLPPRLVPRPLAGPLAPWRSSSARPVGWAVACALFGASETMRRLGPFDERFFLYGEDLELGLRAARLGVQTWFWPSARVLHHQAHSTSVAFGGEPFDVLARARRAAVAGVLGPGRAQLDDGAQALTFAGRILAKRVLGRPAERERRQLASLLRARRGQA